MEGMRASRSAPSADLCGRSPLPGEGSSDEQDDVMHVSPNLVAMPTLPISLAQQDTLIADAPGESDTIEVFQ